MRTGTSPRGSASVRQCYQAPLPPFHGILYEVKDGMARRNADGTRERSVKLRHWEFEVVHLSALKGNREKVLAVRASILFFHEPFVRN